MFSPRLAIAAFLMAAAISVHVGTTDAFVFASTAKASARQLGGSVLLHSEKTSATPSAIEMHSGVTINEKITVRDPTPEERGKGGVEVVSDSGGIKALEILARINSDLIVTSADGPDRAMEAASSGRNSTWATDLTAATLAALHPTEEERDDIVQTKKEWIQSWQAGGWATLNSDLGDEIAGDVLGCLLAMGSDNDKNIYAKFRMPCHPVLLKASMGLEVLTGCTADEARGALTARGFTYRSMRDALQPLVLKSTVRPKGTVRDKRVWDVADTFSRVLSRATKLQLEGMEDIAHAIIPLHERLAHSLDENTKLVSIGNEILIVASRDIAEGEPITRDYTSAPRMANDELLEGSALHLLLQFGLPPKAWPKD